MLLFRTQLHVFSGAEIDLLLRDIKMIVVPDLSEGFSAAEDELCWME